MTASYIQSTLSKSFKGENGLPLCVLEARLIPPSIYECKMPASSPFDLPHQASARAGHQTADEKDAESPVSLSSVHWQGMFPF